MLRREFHVCVQVTDDEEEILKVVVVFVVVAATTIKTRSSLSEKKYIRYGFDIIVKCKYKIK